MAFILGFADSTPEGYSADQFNDIFKALVPYPCVFIAIGNAMLPIAGPGVGVTVRDGFVFCYGLWIHADSNALVSLASNSSGATRNDYVVLEIAPVAKTAIYRAINGTPALPALTQSSTLYQLPIASVAVLNGATAAVDLTVVSKRPLWPSVQYQATSTSATAGAASALPGAPAGYTTEYLRDGTPIKRPYWNV